MQRSPTRRRLLRGTALTGVVLAAGCLSSAAPDGATTGSPTATDASTTGARRPPEDLESWLAEANGYDGGRRRYGRGARPSVWVGDPTDDGPAFDPPVVQVPPMTAVHWDWAGHGGQHNVVALDGTFDSGRTNAQSGTCYRYLFEEPGTYPYVCEPHTDAGMRGAVIVRELPSSGNETVDRWLGDLNTWNGTITDRTGADRVTVTVGAEGNGGRFGFAPPALRVDASTTLAWEWTGEGGAHNVVFEDLDVDSGEVVADPGVHFEHTVETAGTHRYYCAPHRALGMKGAVVVE